MNRDFLRNVRKIFLCGASTLVVGFAAISVQAEEPRKRFQIEAQPLSTALTKFAEQSDIVVMAPGHLVNGKRAPSIEGVLSPADALDKLLQGTGLAANRDASGAIFLAAQVQEQVQVEEIEPSDRQVADEAELEADEIIVTGTNIRGIYPDTQPILTFDRGSIEQSGFATTADFLATLPQNFTAEISEDTRLNGGGSADNRGFNTGINLRGLGSDATLTLINGRRVAPSSEGTAVDISIIPASAIERIEVLTDGASAIYGTDAVAGVVNFVLGADFDGAETSVRYGTVTDGGLDEVRVSQAFGKSWGSGNAFISYEFYDRDNLAASERVFAASCDLRPLGGANLCPDAGSTAFGGGTQPITLLGANGIFTAPAGQDGRSLTFADLVPGAAEAPNNRVEADLLPATDRHSIFGAFQQELTNQIEVFAEGGYSDRDTQLQSNYLTQVLVIPASNAFLDPSVLEGVNGSSANFLLGNYAFIDEFGPIKSEFGSRNYFASGGLRFYLGSEWLAEAYGAYSDQLETDSFPAINRAALNAALASSNPETALNVFGDGSGTAPAVLASIIDIDGTEVSTDVLTFGGKLDGPLFSLPGGEIKAAFGVEYREESFAQSNTLQGSIESIATFFELDRNVSAVFGELYLPIIGESNRLPGVERIDISASARFEDYSDFGNTMNPKVGLVWTPVAGLDIRGTYGTSFQAPFLKQLDTATNEFVIFNQAISRDPNATPEAAADGVLTTAVLSGNRADLGPEEATSWSLGAKFSPTQLPGFSLDITYFNVAFENRITSSAAAGFAALFANPNFTDLILRRDLAGGDDAAFLAAVDAGRAESPIFRGDFSGGLDVEYLIDIRLRNQARADISGLDVLIDYAFDTDLGSWRMGANATYTDRFETQETPSADFVDVVDTIFNLNDFRLRGNINWAFGGLDASVFINHTSGYTDNQLGNDNAVDVAFWTTVDLSIGYDLGEAFRAEYLSDTTLRISVQNVLDEDPPFVEFIDFNGGFGYDPTQATPIGRFMSFEIRKNW